MYFCGHDHFFNHAQVDDGDDNPDNDVHQLVVATAGAPGYAWCPPYVGDNSYFDVIPVYHAERYGYVLVEIDGLDVTATWMERQSLDPADPAVLRAPARLELQGRRDQSPAADLNGDGIVDFADLAIFSSQWLTPAPDHPQDSEVLPCARRPRLVVPHERWTLGTLRSLRRNTSLLPAFLV